MPVLRFICTCPCSKPRVHPLQTYDFMKKLRAAASTDEKKKMLAARQEASKSKTDDEKKTLQKTAKDAYTIMYTTDCVL